MAILRDHIQTVVSHFRGRVAVWSVVNEAFTSDGELRDNIWLQTIGPEYIAYSYYWAHKADPNAILLYNDYGIEVAGPKADAIFEMVETLQSYNIAIDGIGFQAHLALGYYDPTTEAVMANMERFANLGLEIHFTETTVMIYDPASQEQLDMQAESYCNMLRACLSSDVCNNFTLWGITDLYSYFDQYEDRGWVCIYDDSYQPKPSYHALIDMLNPNGSSPLGRNNLYY
jgi:endo-1,4-beta-xylanase